MSKQLKEKYLRAYFNIVYNEHQYPAECVAIDSDKNQIVFKFIVKPADGTERIHCSLAEVLSDIRTNRLTYRLRSTV